MWRVKVRACTKSDTQAEAFMCRFAQFQGPCVCLVQVRVLLRCFFQSSALSLHSRWNVVALFCIFGYSIFYAGAMFWPFFNWESIPSGPLSKQLGRARVFIRVRIHVPRYAQYLRGEQFGERKRRLANEIYLLEMMVIGKSFSQSYDTLQ